MPQTFISLRDRNETFQNGKRFRDKNFHWVIGEGLRWVKWLGKVLFFMQLFLQCILYCVAKVKERYFTMFHNRLSLSFIRSQWDGYHELLWNWKFEVDCLLAVVLQHWNSWALSIKRDFMVVWILIMVQNNSNQKYNKRKDGTIYQNVRDTLASESHVIFFFRIILTNISMSFVRRWFW